MVKYNTLKPYMDTQEIPLRSQCKVFENQGRNPTSTLHPSSGSGGWPPIRLLAVGCSPGVQRRGIGERGVQLPALAAAAVPPDLLAGRPPAGADPPPVAAQRTLSPACAPRRMRGLCEVVETIIRSTRLRNGPREATPFHVAAQTIREGCGDAVL